MYDAAPQQQEQLDGPGRSRPAFVAWQAGGQQNFPNDPVLEAYRRQQLRAAGRLVIRRRAAEVRAA